MSDIKVGSKVIFKDSEFGNTKATVKDIKGMKVQIHLVYPPNMDMWVDKKSLKLVNEGIEEMSNEDMSREQKLRLGINVDKSGNTDADFDDKKSQGRDDRRLIDRVTGNYDRRVQKAHKNGDSDKVDDLEKKRQDSLDVHNGRNKIYAGYRYGHKEEVDNLNKILSAGLNEGLKLKDSDIKIINDLLKSAETKEQVKHRCHILLDLNKGMSYEQVATKADTSVSTIERTVSDYNKNGVHATLTEDPRSGAGHALSKAQEGQVLKLARSGSYKSYQEIADKISGSSGVKVSDETVRLLCKAHGIIV